MDFTVAVIAAEHTAAPEPSGLVHHKQAEHTAAVVASIGRVRNLVGGHHESHLPLFL